MLNNFDIWDIYVPCSVPQNEVSLIFFISRSHHLESMREVIMKRAKQSHWVTKCFASVEVTSADMTAAEDNYWLGSRVQFEKFLMLQFLSQPSVVRYVMYMEPDCFIFRANWVPLMQATCLEEDVFLIKGHRSKPRFSRPYDHINGNALYALGDARLSNFYFNIYSQYLKYDPNAGNATSVFHLAYDMDIHEFLDYARDKMDAVAEIRRLVVSSQFMQNYFHMNYTLTDVAAAYPTAFIVHGGYRNKVDELLWLS